MYDQKKNINSKGKLVCFSCVCFCFVLLLLFFCFFVVVFCFCFLFVFFFFSLFDIRAEAEYQVLNVRVSTLFMINIQN